MKSITIEKEFKSNLSTDILSELNIEIRARNEETLRRLTNDISSISKGEIIEVRNKEMTSIIRVRNDSQANLAVKLALETNHCFFIKPSERGLIIEEITCPPCREGAISNLPDKYFLLADGKVIEKRGDKTYLVYVCKVKRD